MPHSTTKPLALAISTALGLAASADQAFAARDLGSGYQLAAADPVTQSGATKPQAPGDGADLGTSAANPPGDNKSAAQPAAKPAPMPRTPAKKTGKTGEQSCGEGACGSM